MTQALLRADALSAGYNGHAVITDITLTASERQVIAVIGSNGAGKTTALKAFAGVLPCLAGTIELAGRPAKGSLHARARQGLAYVADDRSIFRDLSVADNFKVSGGDDAFALAVFPELSRLWKRRVGLLSGGEQQMVATGRALARHPKILLIDELSLGLAPLIVERLLRALREAADAGTAIVIVEQYVRHALAVADHVYVLNRGKIALEGPAATMATRLQEVEASYFATSADVRDSR
jgi:branched-chain amino acid transport system ATP-binding protein